jgi:pimeloyl-ACP methyl ester carboxylesterase
MRRLPGEVVYSLDLPGHGESEGRGDDTISGYLQQVLGWLDSIRLTRVVWVGHSMGGAISLTAALTAPERTAGLVLVGTGARLRVNPAIMGAVGQPATFPQAVDTIIKWAFSPQASERLTRLARNRMAQTPPEVLLGDFSACDRFDAMARLGEISVPTLVICGKDDKLTPEKYSHYLAESIPNASLHVIEAAGHMVMLERPKQVAEAVRDFLTKQFP